MNEVEQMCARGGFNLTKFVSIEREDLSEHKLADSVKNIVPSGTAQIERAFRIFLSIENDYLGFKIALKDVSLSRRGVIASISSISDPLGIPAPERKNDSAANCS